ncbi:MAG: putative rane protein [Sphingomonas bacterium]|nr:putative rane protein [Sphingomonas bacterium]
MAARAPVTVDPAAPPAPFSAHGFANLVKAEFRLIGEGRPFLFLAGVAATIGAVADYRQFGSPAALLLLIFGLSAHGARSETLRALTRVHALSPTMRRAAFVIAGTGWALLMALPGAATHLSLRPLMLALAAGGGAAVLAAISRAAFAPRLVLLILWYGYFSTGA